MNGGCTQQEPNYNAIALPLSPSTEAPPAQVQYTLRLTAQPESGRIHVYDGTTLIDTCPRAPQAVCESRWFGNEVLALEAKPMTGWRFDRWEGCEAARNAQIVVRIPKRDLECKAKFFNFDDGFDVAVLPDRIATYPGIPASAQLAIERGANFGNLPVTFELVGAPTNVTLALPSAPVDANSVALSIDVFSSQVPGQYPITLKATASDRSGQPIERNVRVVLVVLSLSGFHVELSTPSLALSPGTTCPLPVVASRGSGFTDPIALSNYVLPPGVTATFDTNPMDANNSNWLLTADPDAAYGEGVARLTGHARNLTREAGLRVAVTAAMDSCATERFKLPTNDDFALAASTTGIVVAQGQSGAVDIRIDRSLGYVGEVVLQASGALEGVVLKFDPAGPVTGNGARLLILAAEGATRGASTIIVTGTGNNAIRQTTFQLTISPGNVTCPLGVLADATVSPGAASAVTLTVGSNRLGGSGAYKAYLAFDASRIPQPFERVDLVVSLLSSNWVTADPQSTRGMSLYGIVDDNDWKPALLAETAITWNNAPKNDTTSTYGFVGAGSNFDDAVRALGTFVVRSGDVNPKQYRIDITNYVRWRLGEKADYSRFTPSAVDRLFTIALGNDRPYHLGGDGDWTAFYPRETASVCSRPHLEVYRQ